MELNVVILMINIRLLNGSDHELEAHRSAENKIHSLGLFHRILKVHRDLR